MSIKRQVSAPLPDRIAAALRNETPSEDIAALIIEAEQACAAAEQAHVAV